MILDTTSEPGWIQVKFDDGMHAKVKCAPAEEVETNRETDFIAEAEAWVAQLEENFQAKKRKEEAIVELANSVLNSDKLQKHVEAKRSRRQADQLDTSGKQGSMADNGNIILDQMLSERLGSGLSGSDTSVASNDDQQAPRRKKRHTQGSDRVRKKGWRPKREVQANMVRLTNTRSGATREFATADAAQNFIGLCNKHQWERAVESDTEYLGWRITIISEHKDKSGIKKSYMKPAPMYGKGVDSSVIVVPPVELPPPEAHGTSGEVPANLANVAGHSGRLYVGPQNRVGRGRDYLVVKRKVYQKDPLDNQKSATQLRPVVHGTQYDVTSMQRDKYLALDPDSEDGYWYIANIFGLKPSGVDVDDDQYVAYISWPAFEDYDPCWQPYRNSSLMPFEAVDAGFFEPVESDTLMPKLAWAYQRKKQN